jgi:hypothetical protein
MTKSRPFKSRSNLADMSKPPEQRRRKTKTTRKNGKGATAQMNHASGKSEASKLRRTWDKKNKRR